MTKSTAQELDDLKKLAFHSMLMRSITITDSELMESDSKALALATQRIRADIAEEVSNRIEIVTSYNEMNRHLFVSGSVIVVPCHSYRTVVTKL